MIIRARWRTRLQGDEFGEPPGCNKSRDRQGLVLLLSGCKAYTYLEMCEIKDYSRGRNVKGQRANDHCLSALPSRNWNEFASFTQMHRIRIGTVLVCLTRIRSFQRGGFDKLIVLR